MNVNLNNLYQADLSQEHTWYEKERRKFAEQPFSSLRERHDFNYPIANWKNYCNDNRGLRREHYTVESYHTLDAVQQNPLFHQAFQRADGKMTHVYLWPGAIEELEIDAIVNAANETLLGGGGVDQAIHAAAGPLLVKECAHIKGGCEVGEAKMTKGYNLPAHYVLHTVGPILADNLYPDVEALKNCYRSCLALCEENHLTSVAFPCISCGFYGFPVDLSAATVLSCIEEEINKLHYVKNITFCLFSEEQKKSYCETFINKNIGNKS